MSIFLRIEDVVLNGVLISPDQGPLLRAALEAELTRLLFTGGLNESMQTRGASQTVRTASIQLGTHNHPVRLGEQIAGAMYEGIGN